MKEENIAALFGEIYEKYYKKIFRFFRQDFSVEDSEDLTQQSFLQLWAWLPRAHGVRNGGALVYRIAKNVRADWYRSTARLLETLPLYDFVEIPAPDGQFEALETRLSIHALSIKEQELLLMRVQGCTSAEIGKAFGISASAARTRLQKIRKKLISAAD